MKVAAYTRVSTEGQNLDRQIEATNKYATQRLGAAPNDVVTFRDKTTGTDTKRDDYQEMMERIEAGEFDAVVTNSVSRISRSIRDLDRIAERIVEDADTELHFISEGMTLLPEEEDPYQTALFRLLGVFAELEAELAQQRTKEGIATRMADEEYHHGPAPLGFDKSDGYLIEADGYDRVRTVLEMVQDGELSKRQAAKELDTSRRTLNRALDRAELYGLEHKEHRKYDQQQP